MNQVETDFYLIFLLFLPILPTTMLPSKIAFVDIETTGGRAERDRVIEIGIVRVEDNKITNTYQSLINPDRYVPAEIELLTGIKSSMLEKAPSFKDISETILESLSDCVFVAHNVRFDYSFLLHEFERLGHSFSMKHFCTVKLSRTLFPQFPRHNLDAIIQRYNLTCENRHRAFDDAHMLYQFYQKLQETLPMETLVSTITTLLKSPTLPPLLSKEVVKNLPRRPGVYIFYDQNQTPLYVGKSKNIYNRVLSHFSSDIRSEKELAISQQVAHIETLPTAGELGALFLESQYVKSLLPIYNRKLRVKQELIACIQQVDSDGYHTVTLSPISKIDHKTLSNYLGFFRSRKQAKEFLTTLAKKHSLCQKRLGLEKTAGSCFSYRLGTCTGACIQKEDALLYNLRFLTAFAHTRIKEWPFNSPIAICEEWDPTGEKEFLLFDKWSYLGSIKTQDGEEKKREFSQDILFDLDIYQILLQYFRSPTTLNKVKILGNDMDLEDYSQKTLTLGEQW